MIVLFTDFSEKDPYVGQVHAVLAQKAPGVPIIDLFHNVPDFDIRAAAYLLPAYTQGFPVGTVFVCVVDPGVGGYRNPVIVEVNGQWYVGPDNGLFQVLCQRAVRHQVFRIDWRPDELTDSFHGRDLFAPVAAKLATGQALAKSKTRLCQIDSSEFPDDLNEVIYIDHYGNAVTGIRASRLNENSVVNINDTQLGYARVFSSAKTGQAFWHHNSSGLVEIAVNCGHAASVLGLSTGSKLAILNAN
ncbi:MAG: SAM-dependent chlorinase/fluorinase [Gammaproteobacteria bacterium]|nr:MAG: SAM-dependent chlorinase/fluorinase [Gammaproteobacteria bacterium]